MTSEKVGIKPPPKQEPKAETSGMVQEVGAQQTSPGMWSSMTATPVPPSKVNVTELNELFTVMKHYGVRYYYGPYGAEGATVEVSFRDGQD
jgi:hypothetical protein